MVTPTVIFLHIPKTAGTTLNSLLSWQYLLQPSYWSVSWDSEAEGFKSLTLEQRASLRLLRGHMEFGLHTYLPQPAVYISFVREPIARMISYWRNAQREARKSDSKHWWIEAARALTFEEFIALGRVIELDNGQVRRISGMKAPFGECSRDMLEQAKQNVEEHFALIAPMRRFDEAIILLKRMLAWRKPLGYLAAKVSKPNETKYSETVLGLLRELNELDRELYDFVEQRFAQCVAEANPPLGPQLRRLRTFNRYAWLVVPPARFFIKSPARFFIKSFARERKARKTQCA